MTKRTLGKRFEEYFKLKEIIHGAERQLKPLKEVIDAETGKQTFEAYGYIASYTESAGTDRVDLKRVKAERPDLFAELEDYIIHGAPSIKLTMKQVKPLA